MSHGSVTVRRETRPYYEITQADKVASLSLEILTSGNPLDRGCGVTIERDLITLTADNGMVRYRVAYWDVHERALVASLITSTVEGITP